MKRRVLEFALLLGLAGCDEGATVCASDEEFVDGACLKPTAVQLNSVGFLPDRAKRATSPGPADSFQVLRDDGSVAFTGGALAARKEGELTAYELDFSSFSEPGRYHVEVPGVGRSPDFTIGEGVYRDPFFATMLSFYGQRCGTAVHFQYAGDVFAHGECHADGAFLDYVTGDSGSKPSKYGWHDAGDYGKYTVNGAFAAGLLLKAWEHFRPGLERFELELPERGGALPDLLDEVKFQLEWLFTMEFENGAVSHKVTAQSFESMIAPEHDRQRRFFAPLGSAATATFAAVMAQAARVYAEFDPAFATRCRDAALRAYAYLIAHPDDQRPDLAAFDTGAYTTGDRDDRAWAAAEVWETTGDPAALADVEARVARLPPRVDWDWSELGNLALFTYALSARPGKNPGVQGSIEGALLANADQVVANTSQHPYGRGVGAKYYWGTNGTVVRTALNLSVAQRLAPKDAYLDAIVAQVDHVLGRNPYGRSLVTGIGARPPRSPHHRPSAADGVIAPWPGLLVGGPHPTPDTWVDSQSDYETNEVAINWSAALAYALAAFVR